MVAYLDGHSIPNKLSAVGEGEVAHVFGAEFPSFGSARLGFLALPSLSLRGNDDGLREVSARLGKPLPVGSAENTGLVHQGSGGGNQVVARDGNGYFIVSKGQGKLALA